jgi:hypothetical protein
VYPELSNVIEFERLFSEMNRAMEKVCNIQVEFWTHRRYCWCARSLPGDQDLAALGALPGEKEYQEPPRNPRGADASKTTATARAAARAKHNPPSR